MLCRPTDFIYREVGFAALPLASGDFKPVADQSPGLNRFSHVEARLGCPFGSKILPCFGSGIHLPNVLPESAPDSSVYWFKGVLVILADRLDNENRLKAAIATATEVGCESGCKTFDSLVQSVIL
jgi:hypothetical protein